MRIRGQSFQKNFDNKLNLANADAMFIYTYEIFQTPIKHLVLIFLITLFNRFNYSGRLKETSYSFCVECIRIGISSIFAVQETASRVRRCMRVSVLQ